MQRTEVIESVDDPALKTLSKMVAEFFEVQASFHYKMHKLMQACGNISGYLSEQQQQSLQTLSNPYGVLIANPFEEKPTGQLDIDITHIFGVINEQNHHFQKTLPALMLCAANLHDFNKLLHVIEQNPKLKQMMLTSIDEKSWQYVEGYVSLPFQNLMRYDLLLETIRKMLEKVKSTTIESTLHKVMEIREYLEPELKFIDEHRETLTEINKIDALILTLQQMNLSSSYVTLADKRDRLSFTDKVIAIRLYISEARSNIAKGSVDVLQTLEGLCELLKNLQEGTENALNQERNTYTGLLYGWMRWSSTALFGADETEIDPRMQLTMIIRKLQVKCELIAFVKEKEERAGACLHVN